MRFYSHWILPRMLDMAMRQSRLDDYRRRALATARGAVLEIGVGSGLNLPLYGRGVERVYAVDPSAELLALARVRGQAADSPVSLIQASAERLPLASESVDTVVMTWTLCTIPDALTALAEVRRVLKGGGRLLFVEHGFSPEPGVSRWQNRLTPVWRRISGGCHLNRKMDQLIRAAGFEIGELRTGYMQGPKPMTFMYEGWAKPVAPSPR